VHAAPRAAPRRRATRAARRAAAPRHRRAAPPPCRSVPCRTRRCAHGAVHALRADLSRPQHEHPRKQPKIEGLIAAA
jgi:hypothetical protein